MPKSQKSRQRAQKRKSERERARREQARQAKARAEARKERSPVKLLAKQAKGWDLRDDMPPQVRRRKQAHEAAKHGRGHMGSSQQARAILIYLDMELEQHQPGAQYPMEAFNQGYIPAKLRNKSGSPAKRFEREQQRILQAIPDPQRRETTRILHHIKQLIEDGAEEYALVDGLLGAAAEMVSYDIQLEHGLHGEEHRSAITQYLKGLYGQLAHSFAPEDDFPYRDLPGYWRWRRGSSAKILDLTKRQQDGSVSAKILAT